MAQGTIRTLHALSLCKLPPVVCRLIEENRQRRLNRSKTGGDFRGRLDKTVAYLRWKSGCSTISGAVGYIASELERERLYALYQKLFPKEWKKSSASFKRTGYNEYHTEREYEFIELVSDRYFLGFLLETAALIGVDACPMEGFDAGRLHPHSGIGQGKVTRRSPSARSASAPSSKQEAAIRKNKDA